ncbi:hypothetical protein [Tengunoibacter tsumagoiensis]|uniref:Uncharacterized protein n=1 Tax=Tengunoibacter tsumagoiensis TaxID=2014871 RepID=A0A402A523_9CHLR|nr:hypothetical protein [Tengunoibacter tsumagoiensis]GCE14202.1 hypothetical protein KTT_40610 [Tengunoibacter tsumagoiensis]GCE14256.1 hypothetical protein KTT_41150 [Tengunoibacter tsumagoiensis]
MSRRKSIATKQIRADHWDAHEVVIIRSLNTEDEEQIQDEIASVNANSQVHLHTGRVKRLTLQRGIVSWTLTDDQNRPLPLNEQSIRGLDRADSKFIFDEIEAISAPLSAEEKKESTTSATHGIEVVATASHSK